MLTVPVSVELAAMTSCAQCGAYGYYVLNRMQEPALSPQDVRCDTASRRRLTAVEQVASAK